MTNEEKQKESTTEKTLDMKLRCFAHTKKQLVETNKLVTYILENSLFDPKYAHFDEELDLLNSIDQLQRDLSNCFDKIANNVFKFSKPFSIQDMTDYTLFYGEEKGIKI